MQSLWINGTSFSRRAQATITALAPAPTTGSAGLVAEQNSGRQQKDSASRRVGGGTQGGGIGGPASFVVAAAAAASSVAEAAERVLRNCGKMEIGSGHVHKHTVNISHCCKCYINFART